MSGGRGVTRRPALLPAILLLLAIVSWAALAQIAVAWAQEKIGVDAGVHDGFARIVFTWPSKVAYEAKLDGNTVSIHFARPLTAADLAIIARRADTVVEHAALKDDQTVLLTLRHPVELKDEVVENNKIVIDLVEPKARKAEKETPPAKKPETKEAAKGKPAPAAKEAPAKAPPKQDVALKPPTALAGTRVKVLDKDGGKRLVFDWPKSIDYSVAASKDKTEATLVFRNAGPIDAAHFAVDAPELAPRVGTSGKDTTVALKLPPGARLSDTRDGNSIILDIATDKAPADQAGADKTGADKTGDDKTGDDKTAAEKTGAGSASADTAKAAPDQPAAGAEGVAAPAPGTAPAQAAAAPAADPAAKPGPSVAGAEPQSSSAGPDAESATFRFDWHKPVAMALFRRANVMWLVFDQVLPVNLADLRANRHAAVSAIDAVPHTSATILRFALADGMNPTLRRTETEWVVDVRRQPLQPEAPVVVQVQATARPPRVFFAVREPGEPIAFRDPEVGDTLVAAPASQLGQGVAREERFVDFTALSSVQGIGLRPNSDSVVAKSLKNGVEVTSKTGLALSTDADRVLHRSDAKSHLFNFSEWYGPKDINDLAQRRQLEAAIVAAPAMSRWSARLDLAHFYFAHGLVPEALGVIAAIQRNDPSYAADPRVRALDGATLLLAGENDGAAQEFDLPVFNDEPEAALWRGSLAYAKGDWANASTLFQRGNSFLVGYPKALRNRFALEAAKAAFETGRHADAEGYLDMVLTDAPNDTDRAAAQYLQARELQVAGETDKADALLGKVAEGDVRPLRARATLARTLADLDAGKISRADAIEALDGLRFAWRGDNFELELLRHLGELKIKDADYRGGFEALRSAVENFPDSPDHAAIKQQLVDAFTDVFLGPNADGVPPLKALAVYDEFKDLTPQGSKGDDIVRKLTDRLVSVDLLDRAGDLLENQVKNRLTGGDKARVAARLALVRLLDRKPQQAIAALDIDVGKDVPLNLQRQRQQLRARALIDLEHYDDALKALGDDGSRDADRLRADAAWRSKNWAEAAQVFRRLTVDPDASGKLDDEAARTVLNLGTTLTLANDQSALAALGHKYTAAMDQSPYKDAFRILTGSAGPAHGDIRQIAGQVAQVNDLHSFMADYKQKLQAEKLSAIN